MPQLGLPGSEPTEIFSISDIDWQRLPELQKRARDSIGIADGKIVSVVVLKPKREFGDSEIEWRIRVQDKNAPIIWTPNSPPVRRGTAVFDARGALLRTVFPPGEGPKVDLLDPPVLGKALAAMIARIGPDLKAAELEVTDDEIALTAVDPKNPNSLAVFTYRNQETKRDTGARAMIANSMGLGPGALFDLASLEPAISGPLAALQRETISRLAMQNGRVIRLTFSKDKLFRPGNDKVLIEIRVAGDGPDHQWINYDLSGNAVENENAVKSGIRVVRPVSRRDEEDCTSASEPATAIAACTRLIESGQFAGHDLAVFHYDRGFFT